MDLQMLLDKAEVRLRHIHPELAKKGRELVKKAHAEKIYIIISQGLRSTAEQNSLYAQGRTKAGKIVTNVKGGYSYHNFGLAFDFAVLDTISKVNWNVDSRWRRVGAIGKSLGLEWGGDWTSFRDYPHFQLTYGLTTAQLRAGRKPPGGAVQPKSYLQYKDTGSQVKKLQEDLIKLGYKLTADSSYGPAVRSAVTEFQKKHKLSADGIAGAATFAKIEQELKKLSGNSTKSYLQYKDTGDQVKKLQEDLNKLGYKLTADGSYGPAVRTAVTDFQKKHKLSADGIAGKATFAKISDEIKKLSSGGATKSFLQYKDTGAQVKKLQEDLNKLGYKLTADGSYGPAVRSAVTDFQKKHKLSADGIAGKATFAKIEQELKKR